MRTRLHARRHAQVCSAAAQRLRALAEGPGPTLPVAAPCSPCVARPQSWDPRCGVPGGAAGLVRGLSAVPGGQPGLSRPLGPRGAQAGKDRGAQRPLRKGRHRRVFLPALQGRGRLRLPVGSTDGVRRPRCPCEPTGCMRGNTCVRLHGLAGLHIRPPQRARAGLRPRFALVLLRHDGGGECCGSGGVG